MKYRLHEIMQLSELLEHEATGRPFDRARAHQLALTLAEHQPEIRDTMQRVCERMRGGGIRH